MGTAQIYHQINSIFLSDAVSSLLLYFIIYLFAAIHVLYFLFALPKISHVFQQYAFNAHLFDVIYN